MFLLTSISRGDMFLSTGTFVAIDSVMFRRETVSRQADNHLAWPAARQIVGTTGCGSAVAAESLDCGACTAIVHGPHLDRLETLWRSLATGAMLTVLIGIGFGQPVILLLTGLLRRTYGSRRL